MLFVFYLEELFYDSLNDLPAQAWFSGLLCLADAI